MIGRLPDVIDNSTIAYPALDNSRPVITDNSIEQRVARCNRTIGAPCQTREQYRPHDTRFISAQVGLLDADVRDARKVETGRMAVGAPAGKAVRGQWGWATRGRIFHPPPSRAPIMIT